MDEIGIRKKLIGLTEMCMENIQYQVKNTMSESFEVKTGLEQGDVLSLVLFNSTLGKTIRETQKASTVTTLRE